MTLQFNPPSWDKPRDYSWISKSIDSLFENYIRGTQLGAQIKERRESSEDRAARLKLDAMRTQSEISARDEQMRFARTRDSEARASFAAENQGLSGERFNELAPMAGMDIPSGVKSPDLSTVQHILEQHKKASEAKTQDVQSQADLRRAQADAIGQGDTFFDPTNPGVSYQMPRGSKPLPTAASEKAMPGWRLNRDGSMAPIPGGPADIKNTAERGKLDSALNLYETARDGMISGLNESETGPIIGRLPAFTSEQQVAEGGVAAMAPVLKQLFRVSGEGVFTDRDQQLLLDMVPTRKDRAEARKKKIENIDAIVKAKLSTGPRSASSGPSVGDVRKGYKFKGGNPKDPSSWEKL